LWCPCSCFAFFWFFFFISSIVVFLYHVSYNYSCYFLKRILVPWLMIVFFKWFLLSCFVYNRVALHFSRPAFGFIYVVFMQ
jgi:hypothetical protein